MEILKVVTNVIHEKESYFQLGGFCGLATGFAMLYFGVPYGLSLGIVSMATFAIPYISRVFENDSNTIKPTPPSLSEAERLQASVDAKRIQVLERLLKKEKENNETLQESLKSLNGTFEELTNTIQPIVVKFIRDHINVERNRNHLIFDNMALLVQDLLQRVNAHLPQEHRLNQVEIEDVLQNPVRYPNHGQLAQIIRATIQEHQERVQQRDNANPPPQPNVNLANHPNAHFQAQGVEPRANNEQLPTQNPQARVA